MAAKKTPKNGDVTYKNLRVNSETSKKVMRLAAQLQLKSGEKTLAGDAIDYAVEKALD